MALVTRPDQGRRYIISTSLGRKLVIVDEINGDSTVLRKLRAAARRWTGRQVYAIADLIALKLRTPGDSDRDLLRAASDATHKERVL